MFAKKSKIMGESNAICGETSLGLCRGHLLGGILSLAFTALTLKCLLDYLHHYTIFVESSASQEYDLWNSAGYSVYQARRNLSQVIDTSTQTPNPLLAIKNLDDAVKILNDSKREDAKEFLNYVNGLKEDIRAHTNDIVYLDYLANGEIDQKLKEIVEIIDGYDQIKKNVSNSILYSIGGGILATGGWSVTLYHKDEE